MIPDIVIIHCSDTPDFLVSDDDFDKFGASHINLWHKQRGFEKIGYHYVIRRSGVIEIGRNSSRKNMEIGAHCRGENSHSIGVCYVGKHHPTNEQWDSFQNLYLKIKKEWGIDKNSWYCHYQFNPSKSCPGFSVDLIRNFLQ